VKLDSGSSAPFVVQEKSGASANFDVANTARVPVA
jgi:hypothetical protein